MTDKIHTFDNDIELDPNITLEEGLSNLNLKEKSKNIKKRPAEDSEIFISRKRHKKEDKNYKKKPNKGISSEINELYYV